TAAAEAVALSHAVKGGDDRSRYFVSDECHPQTIDVVRTRARARGWDVVIGDWRTFKFDANIFGALVQYPTTGGAVVDYREFCDRALQTREQHIRREKATSNVCTAQVLLAVIAGMYAVYHGPDGITAIAKRVHRYAEVLARGVERLGYTLKHSVFFDTVCIEVGQGLAASIVGRARAQKINLRQMGDHAVCVALDETVTKTDLRDLLAVFAGGTREAPALETLLPEVDERYD